jgi:hypothetical protein
LASKTSGDKEMFEKSSITKLCALTILGLIFFAALAARGSAASASPYGFGVALFQNLNPWTYPANQIVLDRYGIPFDVYNSTDIGVVNLSKYSKVVIASDQDQAFYNAVNASKAWFEEYAQNGGVLEIHAASFGWNAGNWVDSLPGGITYTSGLGDIVDIAMHNHPVVRVPNVITDAELDSWGSSFHGYFTAYPVGSTAIMIDDNTKNPVYLEFPYGSGVIFASSQTLEWVYGRDSNGFGLPFSPLIENSLMYLAPRANLGLKVEVGTIHFRGEIAEFYIGTSLSGNAINASIWEATLYYDNGTQQVDLLAQVEAMAVGLYRIIYAIPGDAVMGTYTLAVKASFRTGTVTAAGESAASFVLSPTLTSQTSYITSISNNIATIVIPDLGTIKANLADINAKVVSINGTTATIETDIGTMQTDVSNINDLATGIDQTTMQTNWLTVASAILAALAAVMAIIIITLVRKRPTVQSASQTGTPTA